MDMIKETIKKPKQTQTNKVLSCYRYCDNDCDFIGFAKKLTDFENYVFKSANGFYGVSPNIVGHQTKSNYRLPWNFDGIFQEGPNNYGYYIVNHNSIFIK